MNKENMYTEEEVNVLIKAFHLDVLKGNYSKEDLDWCNNWLKENLHANMNNEEKYSIPIYENGIKTRWTIDGVIGDEKYLQLIESTPERKLPDMVNVNLKNK
jgi:hypothetical protein